MRKIVMAVIVLCVAVGTMIYVTSKEPSPSQGAQSSSSLSSDAFPSWQPVRNAQWRYALRIPASLSLANKADDASVLRYTQDALTLEVSAEAATSLDSYIVSVDRIRATAYEGQPSITVKAEKDVTVGGQPAKEREIFLNAAGFPGMETIVFREGTTYHFSTFIAGDALTLTDEVRKLHRDMLSTVQFGS